MTRGRLGGVRAWLGAHGHWVYTALVLGPAYVAVYASVYRARPLYAPDTRYYAAMALWFGGTDQATAAERVREYTTATAGWETPGVEALFGWGLVQPRVVYPVLSIPFVKAFGVDGMLVVPAIATVVLIGLLTWMLGRRYGMVAALSVVLLLLSSSQFIFFGIAMLTESLTALWCALILLVCWRYQRDRAWRWVGVLVGLTLLTAFTRQSTLIPAGALVTAWLAAIVLRDRPTRWAKPALAVGVTTVVAQVVQTLVFPTFSQTNQFLRATDTTSLRDAIGAVPGLAWKILRSDLRHYMASDRAMLIFLVLSAIAVVLLWRHSESHLLVGAVLGAAVYNITNGTPTAFRYTMPGVVFFAVAVAALVARTVRRSDDGGPPSEEDTSVPGERVRPEDPAPQRHEVDGRRDDHRDALGDMRLDAELHQPGDQARRH